MRQQEKMIQDMEKSVMRRETIITRWGLKIPSPLITKRLGAHSLSWVKIVHLHDDVIWIQLPECISLQSGFVSHASDSSQKILNTIACLVVVQWRHRASVPLDFRTFTCKITSTNRCRKYLGVNLVFVRFWLVSSRLSLEARGGSWKKWFRALLRIFPRLALSSGEGTGNRSDANALCFEFKRHFRKIEYFE